jgi:uncharacterized membrane protein HdeD (DUF308 family)
METRFARSKGSIIITGCVMVAMGIAVLINPIGAMETIVRILGWILVAFGVVTIVSSMMRSNVLQDNPGELALGILCLVPGLIMGIAPGFVVKFVWTIIGIIILITGVLDIMEAGSYRRTRSPLGVPATASGVICVILGLLVILVPLASPTLGMLVAAVALLVNGLTEIIFGLGM